MNYYVVWKISLKAPLPNNLNIEIGVKDTQPVFRMFSIGQDKQVFVNKLKMVK